jgi:hypothetical protein
MTNFHVASAVAHNGQNDTEMRKTDTWLLAYGLASCKQLWDITIHSGGLLVKIEFPNHGTADPQYLENV